MSDIPVMSLSGVGPDTAARLAEHGIGTVEALAAATLGDLAAIRGFGPTRAAALHLRAVALLAAGDYGPEPEDFGDDGEPAAVEKKKKKKGKNGKGKKKKKKKKDQKKKGKNGGKSKEKKKKKKRKGGDRKK